MQTGLEPRKRETSYFLRPVEAQAGRVCRSERFAIEFGVVRKDLEAFARKTLSDLEPDEVFRWLTTFRWRVITADMVYTDPRTQVPVFHLHGTIRPNRLPDPPC
jgi:hypothetical protein